MQKKSIEPDLNYKVFLFPQSISTCPKMGKLGDRQKLPHSALRNGIFSNIFCYIGLQQHGYDTFRSGALQLLAKRLHSQLREIQLFNCFNG